MLKNQLKNAKLDINLNQWEEIADPVLKKKYQEKLTILVSIF